MPILQIPPEMEHKTRLSSKSNSLPCLVTETRLPATSSGEAAQIAGRAAAEQHSLPGKIARRSPTVGGFDHARQRSFFF